jgi:hypothetical protein
MLNIRSFAELADVLIEPDDTREENNTYEDDFEDEVHDEPEPSENPNRSGIASYTAYEDDEFEADDTEESLERGSAFERPRMPQEEKTPHLELDEDQVLPR